MSDKRTALYQIDTERSLTRNIQLLRDSIVMLAELELVLDNMHNGLAATTGTYRGSSVHVLRGFLCDIRQDWDELKAEYLDEEVAE